MPNVQTLSCQLYSLLVTGITALIAACATTSARAADLRRRSVAVAAMLIAAALAANAQTPDIVPNFLGLGIGSTTQWLGAKDHVTGFAPAARVQLQGKPIRGALRPVRRRQSARHA